jgi:hypothetical protein
VTNPVITKSWLGLRTERRYVYSAYGDNNYEDTVTVEWADWLSPVAFTVSLLVAIALLIGGITWTFVSVSKSQGRESCHRYGELTNRPTKFVYYTYWSWGCLTPDPSQPGTLIPINQLVGVK